MQCEEGGQLQYQGFHKLSMLHARARGQSQEYCSYPSNKFIRLSITALSRLNHVGTHKLMNLWQCVWLRIAGKWWNVRQCEEKPTNFHKKAFRSRNPDQLCHRLAGSHMFLYSFHLRLHFTKFNQNIDLLK